jgi:hypothetical protein
MLRFWPPKLPLSDFFSLIRPFMPSILNRNSKIPLLHFEILTVKGGIFLSFWPIYVRIDGINRRMGPKNQKVVVWGARI